MTLQSRIATLVAGCVLSCSTAAMAVPKLQLDITGGVYDPVSETVVASSNTFILTALAKGDPSTFNFTRDYFVSAAVFPPPDSSGATLGSFNFGGTVVNATADMVYGTPPSEANIAFDANDLSKHGVFPTFFKEFQFNFVPGQTNAPYNSEDDTGDGPLVHPGLGALYYSWVVDVSGLDPGSIVHFDLYNEVVRTGGDIDRDDFAPFSHDAESAPSTGPGTGTPPNPPAIPEPVTATLGGLALLAAGFGATRRSSR